MDLRQYFRKIREIEASVPEQFVFVASLETADGGKAGVITEVPREIAAKQLVEGRAVLASNAQRDEFLEAQRQGREAARKAELAGRVHLTVLADKNEPQPSGAQPPVSSNIVSTKK